jgi:two-component system NarL family sensor kinase
VKRIRSATPVAVAAAKGQKSITALQLQLSEAKEALRAIHNGEVDAVMVEGKAGRQLFTLKGAEQAYRVLIESMNEGALTLATDKTILYANACFAKMVHLPLEQVTGGSFRRFLSTKDRLLLNNLLAHRDTSGNKIQVQLNAEDGTQLAVQVSIHYLKEEAPKATSVSMIVTDMSEAHRTQELLRALMQRVVRAQEAERGRVALELHDTVTQMLCSVLINSQNLIRILAPQNRRALSEAKKLYETLGTTIDEVERISRNLRPSVLEHLGLVAILRETGTEFADRTGVAVTLACVVLSARLPAETELALFRILQESLKNVEKHADAHNVSVCLTKHGKFIQLTIQDDGIGFDSDTHPPRRNGKSGLGVIGMHERAAHVGGLVKVTSLPTGTNIEVRIPILIRRTEAVDRNTREGLAVEGPKKDRSKTLSRALPILRAASSLRSRPAVPRKSSPAKKAFRTGSLAKGSVPKIRNT